MSVYATKVLQYDLDVELQKVFNQLLELREEMNHDSLVDLFKNIDIKMLAPNEKAVVEELVNEYQSTGKLTIQRLEEVIESIKALKSETKAMQLGHGNYTEVFEEDSFENVTKHTVTGDKSYVVSYFYSNAQEGILSHSTLVYTDEQGQSVTIRKDYTYRSNGNIEKIETTTSV